MMLAHMCVYIFADADVYTYVYVYVHTYTYVCMYVCTLNIVTTGKTRSEIAASKQALIAKTTWSLAVGRCDA